MTSKGRTRAIGGRAGGDCIESLPRCAARWRTQNREMPFLQLDARTIDATVGSPTPCWCGGVSPLWYVVTELRFPEPALCRCERVDTSGRRSLLQHPSTCPFPEARGTSIASERIPRDHSSSSSSRLQHQQQQLRFRGPEPWRPPAAAGKPYTCSRQDVFSSQVYTRALLTAAPILSK